MVRHPRIAGIGLAATAALFVLAIPTAGTAAPVTGHRVSDACSTPALGYAACFAKVYSAVTAAGTVAPLAATPTGFDPADLRGAYLLTGTIGGTIAIVDAQDDPTA